MTGTGEPLERKTLKAWREDRGMTQQELAFHTGLHVSSVWAIENKKMSPNLSSMRAIADALDVLMDQILWPMPDEITPSPSHRNRRKHTPRPRTSRTSREARPGAPGENEGRTDGPKHEARVA